MKAKRTTCARQNALDWIEVEFYSQPSIPISRIFVRRPKSAENVAVFLKSI